MSSISRTSTITPETVLGEGKTYSNQREVQLPEINYSNISEISYLFKLVTSNITITTISSIGLALLCHSLYTVRSGVHDICFDCTPSPIESAQASSPSSFTEQSHSSSAELLQWLELIMPAITPVLSKMFGFLLFPVAPIAISAAVVFSLDKVWDWVEEPKRDADVDMPVDYSETGSIWVAQRRSSFVVQFDEDSL